MSVSTTINRTVFNGDGATIAFPFTFKAFENSDIKCVYTNASSVETTLTLDTDYTVSLTTTGGTVTLIGTYAATPPAIGTKITVYRDIPYTQAIDLVENDPQSADVLEEGYDRAVILAQQLKDAVLRSLLLPVSSSASGLTIPEPAASKYLRWNAAGTNLENVTLTGDLVAVSAFVLTLLDDADAAAFLATLGLTISAFAKTLLDDVDAATARATLGVGDWTGVTAFTATPASTSTLTMTSDLTATLLVGTPLKYTIGGTIYYGIVSAITSNLLTVAGAPLSGDVTALSYGDRSRVQQINVIVSGLYEDASNTALIASDLNSSLQWNKTKAYLVRYRVYSKVHDSHATHGQASVRINDTEVNTTAGGLTVAADATWYSTVVDIAVAAYDVNPGEAIEVTAVKGGTGDASDLTVEMTFVIP